MALDFQALDDRELIRAYSDLLRSLRARGIIKSRNLVGDLAEYIARRHYNSTRGLPTLGAAPTGTKDFDAIGRNGKRYSIKGASGSATGQFRMPSPSEAQPIVPKFDYLILVRFDHDYGVEKIIEVSWSQFLSFRQWLPGHKAYNLPVTQKLIAAANVVYTRA